MKKASLVTVIALSLLIAGAALAAAPAQPPAGSAPVPQAVSGTATPTTPPQAWGNRMPAAYAQQDGQGTFGRRGMMMRGPSGGMRRMSGGFEGRSSFGPFRAIAGGVTLLMLWTLMALSISALWKWHKKEKAASAS